MEKYIGVKIIEAKPMTAREAGEVLQRPIATENADAEGNGYLVKYEDGYESWSPSTAFEDAYRKTDGLPFGLAIEALKKGLRVTRKGWNGKGMWVELQTPDAHSKMTRPYIYLVCPKGSTHHFGEQTRDFERVPWLAGQTDVLADDWVIVE